MKFRTVEEWIVCDRCGADSRNRPEMFEDVRSEVELTRFGKPMNPKHGDELVSAGPLSLTFCAPCTGMLTLFVGGHTLSADEGLF